MPSLNDFFSEKGVLIAVCAVFFLIQLAFFPQMFLSVDEHTYLKNSVLLPSGSIAVEDAGNAARSNLYTNDGYVASQFIGKSIFLVPFSALGIETAMLSGILLHMLNFALVILILRRLNLNRLFSLVYLFMPVFMWSARTLYAELLVLTCLLVGLYFYISQKEKHWAVSGLFFGLAVLTRYDAIFAFIAFLIPLLLRERKKAIMFALGAVPIGLFILAFNSFAYGGAISTGYGSGLGMISTMLLGILDFDHVIYAAILLVAPPLLLASPFLAKKFSLRKQFALLTLFYFILNAAFTDFLAFDFSVESALVARLRYLIPLIGLLVIPYSVFLSEIYNKYFEAFFSRLTQNRRIVLIALVSLALLFASAFAAAKHSELIDSRKTVLGTIYSVTPEGSTVIGSSDDCIYFLSPVFGDRKYYNADLAQGLAGNPEGITLESIKGGSTYVMELHYGHRVERNSSRQETISSERQGIADFIENHSQELELVYESFEPNTLRIYRWG